MHQRLQVRVGSARPQAPPEPGELTSDLLTRGCGYGFLRSALTCLIYAFTFCIYAGLEGQILATSQHSVWHIPVGYLYVLPGALFIPLTWYGMAQLS